MKKRLFGMVCILLSVCNSSAQTLRDSVVAYFHSLARTPQEKLYLHIDKPYYGAGEKLWFKGYLLNAVTHQDNMPENFITVELLNQADSVVLRKKIARASTGFHNALVLPATLPAGAYTLRGYSSWMQNQSDDFFYARRLRIGNAVDRNVQVEADYHTTREGEWVVDFRFTQADGAPYKEVMVKGRLFEEERIVRRATLRTDGEGRLRMKLPDLTTSAQRRIEIAFDDPTYLYTNVFPVPMHSKEFNVQFFPEGGALLEGVSQKVAFKVQGADGFSCQAHGKLLSAAGDSLGALRTDYDGMGLFNLSARAGEAYQAEFVSQEGVVRRFPLPEVVKQGFSLSLAERKGNLFYQVQQTAFTPSPAELYVVVHTRGRLFMVQPISPERPFGKFSKAELDNGITHFLLVDGDGNVLSERLFFHYRPQAERWQLTTDRERYGRRMPVNLHLSATDAEGKPLQGTFSVSITDAGCVEPDSVADHIVSNLLLTSDLKGYVEHPADYFRGEDARTLMRADLLMLTHGWRRHRLTNVAHWQQLKPRHLLEYKQTLSGRITGLLGGKVKQGPIFAVAPKQGIIESTTTDKQGRFSISTSFPDSTSFLIQARTKLGFAGVRIHMDEEVLPPPHTKIPFASSHAMSLPDAYLSNARSQYYAEGGINVVNMKELLVTAPNVRYEQSMYVGINDKTYSDENLLESGATTVWDALPWLPGVETDEQGGIRLTRCQGTPLFIVNDIIYDDGESILSTYSPEEVHSLTLVKDASASIFGLKGSGGAIVVTLKHPLDFPAKPTPGIITWSPRGYAPAMEFYHPVYDTPQKRALPTPDVRSTLYWNPALQLDAQGQATLVYYTSDSTSPHDVLIEGIGPEGQIYRHQQRINR